MAIKFGSCFAGVGGFDISLERAGFVPAWQVEVDKNCLKVLQKHWPEVPKYTDIRDVKGAEIEPVDVLCGGFPCTDLSVAGKRAGLAGKHSGLFYEMTRIIKEMREATNGLYPRLVLFENVPGLLSSRKGQDFFAVLDEIEDMGYSVEAALLDAQNFGVPQRRKRVFILCQSAKDILARKTITSATTISQCYFEILGSILAEARGQFTTGRKGSNSLKSRSVDGLLRRMKLFGLTSQADWCRLAECLIDILPKFHPAPVNSESHSEPGQDTQLTTDMSTKDTPTSTEFDARGGVISELWRSTWEESWSSLNLSTISTSISQTTESKIYTCARASLVTCEFIAPLMHLFPNCWTKESSGLTVLTEFINYARQASRYLFTEVGWIQPWVDFVEHAERTQRELIGYFGGQRAGEILALSESSTGNPQPRRKARKGDTGDVAACLNSGGNAGRFRTEPGEHLIAFQNTGQGWWNESDVGAPVRAAKGGGAKEANVVAFAQNQRSEVRQMGGDGQIAGALAADAGMKQQTYIAFSCKDNGRDADAEVAPTLRSMNFDASHMNGGGQLAIAFSAGNGAKAHGIGAEEDVSPPIKSGSSGNNQVPTIVYNMETAHSTQHGLGISEDVAATLDKGCTTAIAFQLNGDRDNPGLSTGEVAFTIPSNPMSDRGQAIAFTERTRTEGRTLETQDDVAYALTNPGSGGRTHSRQVMSGMQVRRFTPLECERLQGFPPDHTAGQSDSIRYRQMGNAVAVPVVEWIAHRIMAALIDKPAAEQ